jgi:hypothetical protein
MELLHEKVLDPTTPNFSKPGAPSEGRKHISRSRHAKRRRQSSPGAGAHLVQGVELLDGRHVRRWPGRRDWTGKRCSAQERAGPGGWNRQPTSERTPIALDVGVLAGSWDPLVESEQLPPTGRLTT